MKKIIFITIGCLFVIVTFLFYYVTSSDATGNLVAYWKLDETTAGSTVVDSSGNGFDGTPHNSPQPSTDVPSTITFSDPESLSFDGSQYVSVPDNAAFASSSATFSLWVKFTNLSAGDMDMIAKRSSDGSQVQWQFGYNAGGNQFKVSLANGGSSCCTDYDWSPSPSLSANTWYNIAVTIDGSGHTLTWYQNGISQKTQDISGTNLGTEISSTDLTLGASYDGTSEFLQGLLDDVRIYNVALSSADVADIAAGNNGPGVSTPTPTPAPTSIPAPTGIPQSQTNNNSNSSVSSTTSTPVCPAATPGTPDLFQIDTNDRQATLYFTPPTGPISNYYVSYGYSSEDERFGAFTGQGDSTGVLSYTVNSLSPNTTYYFKIHAQNDCKAGNWSNEIKTDTSKGSTTIQYYKDFFSQILSTFTPQTTTESSTKPATCKYTVKPGDTLWTIAESMLGVGTDYSIIMQNNNLASSLIHIGEELKIGC